MKSKTEQATNNFELIKNDYKVFLGFLKVKFPLFHNSNVFFRDLQFGIMSYLVRKGIKINNAQAESIAERMITFFEGEKIFTKIDKHSWRLNYPEFVTTVPVNTI